MGFSHTFSVNGQLMKYMNFRKVSSKQIRLFEICFHSVAPRNFLLDPLNFCRTYIFYVKLF
jgi:hypothetical protein